MLRSPLWPRRSRTGMMHNEHKRYAAKNYPNGKRPPWRRTRPPLPTCRPPKARYRRLCGKQYGRFHVSWCKCFTCMVPPVPLCTEAGVRTPIHWAPIPHSSGPDMCRDVGLQVTVPDAKPTFGLQVVLRSRPGVQTPIRWAPIPHISEPDVGAK